MRGQPRRGVLLLLVSVLVATSCARAGSGGEADPQSAIAKSKEAVVQIDVTGTFVDLDLEETTNQEGRGSGFIISKDGLTVTNNHVVTGATKIKVRVPGREEPVPAKVIGASECADLAVIQLDGDGYQTLELAPEPADIGDEVYALGYPLGVRELTLKQGVIEKGRGPEATDWAAVPGVMRHSAEIQPGDSGGPLVNRAGQVVGVNYAGSGFEFFAITAAETQKVVAGLREGKTVESLGLNAQAVSAGVGTGGVFVASLATASPPDRLGVKPGDVLLRLEEQPLANDGTMADYCDVLRSRDIDKPLRVALARLDGPDQGFYTGTLNQAGARLEPLDLRSPDAGSGEVGFDPERVPSALPPGRPYSGFQTLVDDTGALLVRVPHEWGQARKAPANPLTGGGRPLPSLSAAPDLAALDPASPVAFTIPAITFHAFPDSQGTVEAQQLLEAYDGVPGCLYAAGTPFDTDVFDLYIEFWISCNDTPTFVVRAAATPVGRTEIITAAVVVTSQADLDVFLEGLLTFDFDAAAFEAWREANPAPAPGG